MSYDALLALLVALAARMVGAPWWGSIVTYFAALAAFRLHDAMGLIDEATHKQIVVQLGEGEDAERFVPLWVAPPGDS